MQGGGTGTTGNPPASCWATGCSAPAGDRAFYINGLLYAGSKHKLTDAKDGTSNVFLVGETRYGNKTWAASGKQDSCAMPQNIAAAQEAINLRDGEGTHFTRGFSSYHDGGANFVLADGSVHFVRDSIDLATYQGLGQRSDGTPVGGFNQ